MFVQNSLRPRLVFLGIMILFLGIISRLFYWQIVEGYSLKKMVENQATRETTSIGKRGSIYTADGKLLVGNSDLFHVMADKTLLQNSTNDIAEAIAPLLVERDLDEEASASGQPVDQETRAETLLLENSNYLQERLNLESNWVRLSSRVDQNLRQKIEALQLPGIYFEEYQTRSYPEASMAAHLTGFVGKNEAGEDTGYFGIEGALNKELQPQVRRNRFLTDALGNLLGGESALDTQSLDGRDVVLTLRRDVQFLIEQELKRGIERYSAASGEIIVMEVKTGNILGLTAWPNYDQTKYYDFAAQFYKNPSLTNLYERGSTFKVLTVSAGIDTDSVKPDTQCPVCVGPRQIGKYTVRTWNDEYTPDITVRDALAQSNNVAMIYVAETMGAETFVDYLHRFGIGEALHLDLQEDADTPFPDKWGPIELATSAFGQGISTTSLQMVRAVNTIANRGVMMQPKILAKVIDHQTNKEITLPDREVRRVISAETAQIVTEMMVNAAKHGEAQWIFKDTHTIAGKTGTSQIPIAGGYKLDATIASFIGFAPANNPEFIMLVKLIEPRSSPWAAETAAPLWYRIGEKLYLLLNIPPDTGINPSVTPG